MDFKFIPRGYAYKAGAHFTSRVSSQRPIFLIYLVQHLSTKLSPYRSHLFDHLQRVLSEWSLISKIYALLPQVQR